MTYMLQHVIMQAASQTDECNIEQPNKSSSTTMALDNETMNHTNYLGYWSYESNWLATGINDSS